MRILAQVAWIWRYLSNAFSKISFSDGVSIFALIVAGVALYRGIQSDTDSYRAEIRSLRLEAIEDQNASYQLGGEMLMSLTAMLDDAPSKLCEERGNFLLNEANTLATVGWAGREEIEKQYQKWRSADEPDNSELQKHGANHYVGFGTLLREWHADANDTRAFGERMLLFTTRGIRLPRVLRR